ncbi:MAG: hypothetical protein HF978_15275 [Desulfobacteraceae bacterium]|nr:flippase-like domain-containing protein [Desulfobacteraceae bacterium]MBC2756902.1 hypothetical protein [Desulfobacteraceae bacterium]
MKKLYHIVIYLSFIFLCVALYKADYLNIPEIHSFFLLFCSLFFLFAGFIGNALSLKKTLDIVGFRIGIHESIAGVGLTIFGKYIPGKIWMVFGLSSYIAAKGNHDLRQLTILSLDVQIISLWTGLFLGFIGLLIFDGFHLWGCLVIGLWLCLSLVIFSRFLHLLIIKIYNFLFRKDIVTFQLLAQQVFRLVPWYCGYWMLWAIGFYLQIISLTNVEISFFSGLGFPLAGTLGILAIIAPGGLGVREGVLTGYLALVGLPINEATTIAISTRLWFLGGEVLIFFTGWILHQFSK